MLGGAYRLRPQVQVCGSLQFRTERDLVRVRGVMALGSGHHRPCLVFTGPMRITSAEFAIWATPARNDQVIKRGQPDRDPVAASSCIMMTIMAASADYEAYQPVVEAVQQGDHFAFKELLRGQDRWVRGIVYGVLGDRDRVDDVAQQVWTTVWQRIGELRDSRRWRSWLYRLARNAAVDAGRSASRSREVTSGSATTDAATAATPETALAAEETQQRVHRAIASLPDLYREPFVLRHLENWSYRQIADLMEVPVDTIETRLVRARRMLREALSETLER